MDSIKSNANNVYRLISSEVLKRIHSSIQLFIHHEINEFNFYPVWYINGKQFSKSCELYCHFNILIHLLSKVFIKFKSQLLDLAGVDIQVAVAKNQSLDKFIEYSKKDLITRLHVLESENADLINANHSLLDELREMKEESRKREEELIKQNNQTHALLDNANANIDQLQIDLTNANTNIDVLQETLDTATNHLVAAHTKIDNLTELVNKTAESNHFIQHDL